MKATLNIILLVILSIFVVGIIYWNTGGIYYKDYIYLTDPIDLEIWLGNTLRYAKDTKYFDEWKTPYSTIRQKQGDCEDLALVSFYMLKNMGIKSHLLGIYGKYNDSDKEWVHILCVFVWKNELYYFSNLKLFKVKEANNFVDIADHYISYEGVNSWDGLYLCNRLGMSVSL